MPRRQVEYLVDFIDSPPFLTLIYQSNQASLDHIFPKCQKFSTNKNPPPPTNQLNKPPNQINNANLTTTSPTTITTDPITTTPIAPTTMTENPDTIIRNKTSETSLVLSMMSQRSDTTLKFQKCQKNPSKNLTMPNTTKKSKNSSAKKLN